MTQVKRTTATGDRNEGFIVRTRAGKYVYKYVLEIIEQRVPESDERGTLNVYERSRWPLSDVSDKELLEPDYTDSVESVMDEYGYDVA